MKLSLSMIVKNEERSLPGCLESVNGLVDEIVIVDTGSTDSTKKIAERHGARIFDFEWCNDFSAARNESLKNCTGDWVLYLDADERIDKTFHGTIRGLISSGKADAYLLNLKSKIGTSADSQYHLVAYPRLFKRMKGLKFVGKVHEQITTSLSVLRARIVQTDVIIDHLGYAQNDDVIREKARRNYELLLDQIEKRVNYGYALYQLGQTEIVLGEVGKGLQHLNDALAAGGFGKSVRASIYTIIAENKFKQGNSEEALAACDKSLEFAERQTFAHMLKADIYSKLGEYGKSEEAYLKAAEQYRISILKGKVATAIEPVFDEYVLYSKVGKAASLAGDVETAKIYLAKAAEAKPSPERTAAYIEVLLKNGMYHDAADAAKQFKEFENEDWYLRLVSSALIEIGDFQGASVMLEKISEHDKVSWSSFANCRLKLGDFEGAESAFQHAIESGYDDPQGLELFGLAQFRLGKFSEAVETLTKVVQINPQNIRAEKFIKAAKGQLLVVGS